MMRDTGIVHGHLNPVASWMKMATCCPQQVMHEKGNKEKYHNVQGERTFQNAPLIGNNH